MSEKLYDEIGSMAMNAVRPVTVNQLADRLGIANSGRNIHNYLRGAVNHFRRKGNDSIAGRIEGVFVNNDGSYAFNKN